MKNNILFCLFFVLISCNDNGGSVSRDYNEPGTPLILISIDGFRWDYFDKTETPNLDELIESGVRSEGLIPSYPSKTFPNHLSIVTGSYPNNHGLIANRMYDEVFDEYYYIGQGSTAARDGKWINREPIWVTVENQQLRAMTMFWPTSDAEIMGVRPSNWFAYDESITNTQRMEQLLRWIELKGTNRPTFLASYFNDVDDAGHIYGPDTEETKEAIRSVDYEIGILINGLKDRGIFDEVNIMIVSDHGMTENYTDQVIFLDDYIDISTLELVDQGVFVPIRIEDHLPSKIDALFSSLENAHPNMHVYKKNGFPESFHLTDNRRIQDLTVVADDHWRILTHESFNPNRFPKGDHGYHPQYESMHGIFVGHGPGFKSGYIGPRIQNIHLYEMMCKIMDIIPASNDGNPSITTTFLQD
jgi:predicted AlkP superfamily pyrophosphatase or phosphodiesterase